MNSLIRTTLATLAALMVYAQPASAQGIDPSAVKDYGEVFAISGEAVSRDTIEVSWDIAEDYFLYNNQFLAFGTDTPGVVLGEPLIPPGEKKFDELLGEEVIKFRDRLTITLPLDSVPADVELVSLRIRSQGCLEKVLCYPPTDQLLAVPLPPASMAAAGSGDGEISPLEQMLGSTVTGAVAEDASGKPAALPPEEAFVYEAIGLSAETLLVRFTAQPGYYLYVDKFAFRVIGEPDIEVRDVSLPAGTIKDDPEFGPVPVIFDQVEIPIRLNRPAGPQQALVLEADFQGCRDGDICYPPQTAQVELTLAASDVDMKGPVTAQAAASSSTAASTPARAAPISEQGKLAQALIENPTGALILFFLAGIGLAFTPCVFPMIPILSGIIAGEGDSMTPRRAFTLSLVYVLAMAVTYTVAGVLAGMFGQNLQAMFQDPWIISFFVLIFIALAMAMFGFYELQLPSRWQTALTERSNQAQGGKLTGVAIMGFLSALIVGPCVAPPLAAALIVIGETGSPVLGGSALFALSLGMGVPLIIFGVSAGKYLPRAGAWMNAVKAVFGVGLLALAIWMLERILPGSLIMLLWGTLALACAVYLGALERIPEGASGWHRLWKALGLALLFMGAIQFIGATSGGDNWTAPLKHLKPVAGGAAAEEHVEFSRIKSLGDLDSAVAQANARGQGAVLDFYADWCIECIRMERNTFPDPTVQTLLGQMGTLQADVTQNDDIDQALMRKYGIIGPPAILFFDRRGNEMPAYRLVGYFEPDEFSAHLQQVIEAW